MAAEDVPTYAQEILTIVDKMPAFEYTNFCFYAYDSARLFEHVLGMDPRNYRSFSLHAPDAFFYALYGGLSALYDDAKHSLESPMSRTVSLSVSAESMHSEGGGDVCERVVKD
ncbi:hypothetical protein GCM10025857_35950 [Alicyclobacillus contaminans]|nr:hypothetical protein GCM10025857_35950 [Alicyclobacillus contaminans]